jgi:hypothetical protein
MRRDHESSTATTATSNNMNMNNTNGSHAHALAQRQRPKSELFAAGYEIEVRHIDQALAQNNILPSPPEAQRPKNLNQRQQSQSTDQVPQRLRSSKKQQCATAQAPPVKKERSLSVYSFDDLKMAKKLNQERFPLLMRWSRSLSRRMSG